MAKPQADRIYLDHAATTPLSESVREAMLPWLSGGFGNPSSLHADGRRAKDAIDSARETLSRALGSLFAEALFTSGGTEAANLAILGTALQNRESSRRRILLGAAEHHCVLNTAPTLSALGFQVDLIPVDRQARVDSQWLKENLDDQVLLVSVMHANNEFGTLNDIRLFADLAHSEGALLHTDAVQTFLAPGLKWKVQDLDADLVTVSAHKINGPKGTGAIYMRAGVKVKPLIAGGGQEREVRGGTENVMGIVGFGAAVAEHLTETTPDANPRDHLRERALSVGALLSVDSDTPMLRGHLHVRFPGIDAETLLIVLDRLGVSASSGAACSSGSIEPSHVMLAAGYSQDEAKQGVRFSLGRKATVAEAEDAADRLAEALTQIGTAKRKSR